MNFFESVLSEESQFSPLHIYAPSYMIRERKVFKDFKTETLKLFSSFKYWKYLWNCFRTSRPKCYDWRKKINELITVWDNYETISLSVLTFLVFFLCHYVWWPKALIVFSQNLRRHAKTEWNSAGGELKQSGIPREVFI